MQRLLPILLSVFILSSLFLYKINVLAQTIAVSPQYYCVGTNLQPPCTTVSPSNTVVTTPTIYENTPSISPSTTVTNSLSPQPSSSTPASPSPTGTPCTVAQVSSSSVSHEIGYKKHYAGRKGFLQLLFQFILQLLELLLQQIGVKIPSLSPCPSPSPSTTPPVSASPSSQPTISIIPSAITLAPTGTTNIPTSSASGMMVGLNESYTQNQASDIAGAVDSVRYDPNGPETINDFINAGLKIDVLLEGPYETNGVSGLGSPTTWASTWLSWYKSHGCAPTICPIVEVLNEPGGTWFWGSNAMSSTNAKAYGALLEATYNAFYQAYGSSKPAILASYDGGESNSVAWGQEVWSSTSNLNNYVDGVTVHPYGGNTDVTTSAQGYRPDVIAAHTQTGKPVYVTEIGWPTAVGQPSLGNSLQWTEPQQCNNIYNFIAWARGLGYVKGVMIFEHLDDTSDGMFGIETTAGVKKPSYNGLKAAAANQPNPC
jgi:hypothetical protein